MIFAHITGALYEASRHGPFVDSQLQHHQEMKADECDQQSRNHKNMQRKETRESRSRYDRPAQHQFHYSRTNNWNAAGDRCSDPQSPIGVLIETEHLSAEGHAQRHQQQKNTDDPGEFPWKFVSPEKEDLHHVDK